jgi:dephospho-CoA kinase
LRALGAVVVDADEIVRELQEPGQIVLVEMVEHFGDRILLPNGRLDRQAVADIVFGDKEQLDALGRIVHPRVQEELLRRVAELSETDEVVILDIPLLAESGWEGLVGTIVVDLEPEVAVERLVSQRGFGEADARARIANQASREDRLATAAWVVDNSGDQDALDGQLEALWADLQRRRDEALEA